MKSFLHFLCSFFLIAMLSACSEHSTQAKASILDDISGVWRATDSTMVSIIYADKKVRLLFGEDSIPVSLGEVDNVNKTANINVTLTDGKAGVWTIRQLWDSSKTTFHLQLTLHDGTQDELSFVRKISTDDLNKIANAEARTRPGSIGESAKAAQTVTSIPVVEAAPIPAPAPTPVKQTSTINPSNTVEPTAAPAVEGIASAPVAQVTMTFAPSYDCAKASTGPERLICSNKELSDADVKLAQAYRAAANTSVDKELLRNAQNSWRKNVRDACSDVDCMIKAYQSRIGQLYR